MKKKKLPGELDEVSKIARLAREAPEIRADLVEQIKAELAGGEFEGDLDLLAEQLLQELGLLAGDED